MSARLHLNRDWSLPVKTHLQCLSALYERALAQQCLHRILRLCHCPHQTQKQGRRKLALSRQRWTLSFPLGLFSLPKELFIEGRSHGHLSSCSSSGIAWRIILSIISYGGDFLGVDCRINRDKFKSNPAVTGARRLAMVASRIWFAHTLLYTYVGLGWNFSVLELSIVTLMIFWKFFRVIFIVKRFRDQTYFAKIEAEVRMRRNNRPPSASRQPLLSVTSAQSRISVASTAPSVAHSVSTSGPPSPPQQPQIVTSRSRSNSLPGQQQEHSSSAEILLQGSLMYRGTFPFTPA